MRKRSDFSVKYIALSIPLFFLFIGMELLYGLWKGIRLYRFNDTLNNLSQGIGQQLMEIFLKSGLFLFYLFVFEHVRLFSIPVTGRSWFLLFIGVDFFYYWFHRLSHEVNALWAAHVVHHQSEEYNLSVALRQSWFQGIFSTFFYLPLALIGFDPVQFVTVVAFNTLCQCWIHTRLIGKLGPVEWVLNTPSHHRVHHGSDPDYLDKNHGGTLIIWDRLFGTFCEEREEPVYGITTPLASWNPVWANLHYWRDLLRWSGSTEGSFQPLEMFVRPPGWLPAALSGPQRPKAVCWRRQHPYDADSPPAWHGFVLFQFLLSLSAATALIFLESKLDGVLLVIGTLYVLSKLLWTGAVLEGKAWAGASALVRDLLLTVGSWYLGTILFLATLLLILVAQIWQHRLQGRAPLPVQRKFNRGKPLETDE